MKITKIIRKTCENFEPYIAGKSIDEIKRKFRLKSVIKLASNENPLGPSKKAINAIKSNFKNIFLYPDSSSYYLKIALSKIYNLPVKNIFTAAGGDEIIEIIAKLFFNCEDEIIVSKYSFTRYAMAIKLMNSRLISVPMKNGFSYDLDGFLNVCSKKTKAIFITNPNNPTGTYITKFELLNFLKKIPINDEFDIKPLVVLDEAYFEYATLEKDYPNGIDFLNDNPNLIVFRTFSKIYGLAGLRVGYGFANEKIVDYIERIRPPFNVNFLAQIAAAEAIFDKEQVDSSKALVNEEKKYLYYEFQKLKVKYINTAANFILFSSLPFTGNELFKMLLNEGVLVRSMNEYELPYNIRVTIGTHEENKLFIEKLKKCLIKNKK
ncbi:MAG: histidinol-phosphate transaminase [Endomicrobium sp.]|jgi:histidinol-phosphate aminotransferase|nr:histidinol-phosphate transaminase [Endomicrobium sp.]